MDIRAFTKNSQDHGRLSGVWCGVCVCGVLCFVLVLVLVFGRGGVVWVLCVVCVSVWLCVCVNRAVNKVSTKSAFEDV